MKLYSKLFCAFAFLIFSFSASAEPGSIAMKKAETEKNAADSTTEGLCLKNLLATCYKFKETECKTRAATAIQACISAQSSSQPPIFTDKALAKAYARDLGKCASASFMKKIKAESSFKKGCKALR